MAKEELEFRRGYSDEQMEASSLRKTFLRKHIINFDVNFYQTQQERDWAYICKREFILVTKSLGTDMMCSGSHWWMPSLRPMWFRLRA